MDGLQAKLGRTLLKSLLNVREQKGDITLEDVGRIFVGMASTLNPAGSEADLSMHEEIQRLAGHIAEAKKEIFSIKRDDKSEDVIIDASQHLDEVIKHTEQASNTIMDAADIIQQNASGVGGDRETRIMDATNIIYAACNFQDIAGQRITKVIRLLANIEERISKLDALFGATAAANEENIKKNAVKLVSDEKDLLNGPQLSGKAATQDEIDLLFASLGGSKK